MQQIPQTTTIWSFQRRLTNRLLLWALLSVGLGALGIWRGRAPLRRALAWQALGWGAINGAIALGGRRGAERKQMHALPADEIAQARSLRNLLWLNSGLDLLYIAGGVALARAAMPSQKEARRGHGLGIVLQATFLLLFDLAHALAIPTLSAPTRPAAAPPLP